MGRKIQTVEATGKRWKLGKMLGVMLVIFGFVFLGLLAGAQIRSGTANAIGGGVLFSGLGIYAFSRAGAWWYHG